MKLKFTCNGCGRIDTGRAIEFKEHEFPVNAVGSMFINPPRGWYSITALQAPQVILIAVCADCAQARKFFGAGDN